MSFKHSIGGNSVNKYRSQEYSHERILSGGSYTQEYRQKETAGFEDISELFHQNTKLGGKVTERLSTTAKDLMQPLQGILERIDPDYPDQKRIELPPPPELTTEVGTVLESRRSAPAFGGGSFDREQLSQCLHYAVGQSKQSERSRTYPSPGALYPSELFPVLFDVTGCQPGLYYYNPGGHYLRQLRCFPDRETLLEELRECIHTRGVVPDLEDLCVLFVVAADFWRAKFKYGPRGYRYTLQESGHITQNILMTLTAMDLAGRPMAAFHDREINDFVGLDGVNEGVIYMTGSGQPAKVEK